MATAILGSLSILVIAIAASPLPEGQNLVISTSDSIRNFDQMMGDAPAGIGAKSDKPKPKIDSLQVHSDIKFRFAQTLVTSKIRNPSIYSQQISFSVVLPQEAYITGFVMETPEKSYRALLTDRSQAEAEYGKSVQAKSAGALVSYRDSNLFNVSVHVAGYQGVMFKLAYEQLLKREQHGQIGHYRHVITIEPGQYVKGMKVKVHILEPRKIVKLLVPTFAINNIGNSACAGVNMNATCESDNQMVTKTKLSEKEALLVFTPTAMEQKRLARGSGKGMKGQVEVLYDVERHESGGEILVKDGYFVHLFSRPPGATYLPKHIIFVLDVSGSMDGKKITQVKDAMQEILSDIRQDDLFNIILFSEVATAWGFDGASDAGMNDPQVAFTATPKNIENAKQRINAMTANGGTNIFDALKKAVQIAQKERFDHPNVTKPVIFFLTDGEANEGISKPDEIISELDKINSLPKIPIYSFSFGEGGNYEFLKRLSLANSGVARFIYPDADANIQLKDAYKDISNAVLSDVTFKYLPEEVDLSSVTKLNYDTFFEGTELVVSGRTINKNATKISAEVIASGKNLAQEKYKAQSVEQPRPVYNMNASLITLPDPNATTKAGSMERAWAYLTIQQLIDKSKAASPGSPDPQRERAIELAKKYSFASELTSFVVVKPSGDREVASLKRIIHKDDVAATPPPPVFTAFEEPAEDPITKKNLTLLSEVSHQKLAGDYHQKRAHMYTSTCTVEGISRGNRSILPLKIFKLYYMGSLQDVTWLSRDEIKRGYVEMLNRNGTFSAYAILDNAEQLQPEDEPNCEIDKLRGKCRHLSQCVMKEIAQDFPKYLQYYQCELEDYLAICCPHL